MIPQSHLEILEVSRSSGSICLSWLRRKKCVQLFSASGDNCCPYVFKLFFLTFLFQSFHAFTRGSRTFSNRSVALSSASFTSSGNKSSSCLDSFTSLIKESLRTKPRCKGYLQARFTVGRICGKVALFSWSCSLEFHPKSWETSPTIELHFVNCPNHMTRDGTGASSARKHLGFHEMLLWSLDLQRTAPPHYVPSPWHWTFSSEPWTHGNVVNISGKNETRQMYSGQLTTPSAKAHTSKSAVGLKNLNLQDVSAKDSLQRHECHKTLCQADSVFSVKAHIEP